jgi:hypothetical protein
MIFKTSFTVGFLPDGTPELIEMGSAETCKAAFLKERKNPSGKYAGVSVYRKPPYWKRANLPLALPKAKAKAAKKKASA